MHFSGEVSSCGVDFLAGARGVSEQPDFRLGRNVAGRGTAQDNFVRGMSDGVFFAPVDYVSRPSRASGLYAIVTGDRGDRIWPNIFREASAQACSPASLNGAFRTEHFPRSPALRLVVFFRAVSGRDVYWRRSGDCAKTFCGAGRGAGARAHRRYFSFDFGGAQGWMRTRPVKALLERLGPCKIWVAAAPMPPGRPR